MQEISDGYKLERDKYRTLYELVFNRCKDLGEKIVKMKKEQDVVEMKKEQDEGAIQR